MLVGLLLVAALAAGAPLPCVPGTNVPQGDLPGMPLAVPPAAPSAEAWCAAQCAATAACALYTFHNASGSCAGSPGVCAHPGGCCFLKGVEVSGAAPVLQPCHCSGYVRPPASSYKPVHPAPRNGRNVLYILVDDLRPEIEPYGQAYTHTPNLAKLAAGGLLFQNAYCQIRFQMRFLFGK